VFRCVLAECCRLYLNTRACRWLALTLTLLLVVTASHSLFVHRASRVLAFVVEMLNSSSLALLQEISSLEQPSFVATCVRYSPHVVVFVFRQPRRDICKPCLLSSCSPCLPIVVPVLSSLAIAFFLPTLSLAARPISARQHALSARSALIPNRVVDSTG
jgi:hypothetical protein